MTARSTRRLLPLLLAGVTALVPAVGARTLVHATTVLHAPSALAHGWGRSEEIPGYGRLDVGGDVPDELPVVAGVSCTSLGVCTVAGNFVGTRGTTVPFLAAERGGRWTAATEVPGIAALDHGGDAAVESVSCARTGYCSAGGFTTLASGSERAFVTNEVRGRWGRPTLLAVPRVEHRDGTVTALSCTAPGDCEAIGEIGDTPASGGHLGSQQVFQADEHAGAWHPPTVLPRSAVLNSGSFAQADALSCSAPGWCAVGGNVTTKGGAHVPVVDAEVAGRWEATSVLPGYGQLRVGGEHQGIVDSVACVTGSCTAVGWFTTGETFTRAFGDTEVGGVWRSATALGPDDRAARFEEAASVACGTAIACTTVGTNAASAFSSIAFLASDRSGTWGLPHALPGSTVLAGTNDAGATTIACTGTSTCVAAGFVTGSTGSIQAFVDEQSSHGWLPAEISPHSERLNTGGSAEMVSTSCSAQAYCAAIGTYSTSTVGRVAMVENYLG